MQVQVYEMLTLETLKGLGFDPSDHSEPEQVLYSTKEESQLISGLNGLDFEAIERLHPESIEPLYEAILAGNCACPTPWLCRGI